MYIKREVEATLHAMLKQFKVVLVTGARQVGKTTMIRTTLADKANYVNLDSPHAAMQAASDPVLFFESHTLPLIVDEIQKVPRLFSAVKFMVDQSAAYGQIVLTGSQSYHLMKGISESLAGRVGILEMSGLSLREILRAMAPNIAPAEPLAPFLTSDYAVTTQSESQSKNPPNAEKIWRLIHRGSMPELTANSGEWEWFYSSYVRSYLERDVRELLNVRDEMKFHAFMTALAARTGQLFNASDIARVVGIDFKTAQAWLSVLQASGIVTVLPPLWANADKRITKTPKIHFMDAGLACYLAGWTTPEALSRGAMAGHIFESFAVSEIMKSYMNAGRSLRSMFFYRDAHKNEIDLVIQEGRVLHPVEVKISATPSANSITNFKRLDVFKDYKIGAGAVVCLTPQPYTLSSNVQAIPVWGI